MYGLLLYFRDHAADYGMDFDRLAVGGSSAGANYAAALCVKAFQTKEIHFRYQALIYPTTRLTRKAGERVTPLTDLDGSADAAVASLVDFYVPEEEQTGDDIVNPLISPYYGDVDAFPKTAIFSGRRDLLWWEGKTFADKLIACGVEHSTSATTM